MHVNALVDDNSFKTLESSVYSGKVFPESRSVIFFIMICFMSKQEIQDFKSTVGRNNRSR